MKKKCVIVLIVCLALTLSLATTATAANEYTFQSCERDPNNPLRLVQTYKDNSTGVTHQNTIELKMPLGADENGKIPYSGEFVPPIIEIQGDWSIFGERYSDYGSMVFSISQIDESGNFVNYQCGGELRTNGSIAWNDYFPISAGRYRCLLYGLKVDWNGVGTAIYYDGTTIDSDTPNYSNLIYMDYEITGLPENNWVSSNLMSELNNQSWTYGEVGILPHAEAEIGSTRYTFYSQKKDASGTPLVDENNFPIFEESGTTRYSSEYMPRDAGWYRVTVSVSATKSYPGIEADPEHTAVYQIKKREVTRPALPSIIKTYNGAEQAYDCDANPLYTISGDKQTEAGNYTVTVSLNDPNNCIWSERRHSLPLTASFIIAKQPVLVPTFLPQEWTGTTIPVELPAASELYEIEGAPLYYTNVGTYSIPLRLKTPANYMWTLDDPVTGKTAEGAISEDGMTVEVPFVINRKSNPWTSSPDVSSWTYDGTSAAEHLHPGTVKSGEAVSYTYSKTETGGYTDTPPTQAGQWFLRARVPASDEYQAQEMIVPFTIAKRTVSLTELRVYDKLYDENDFSAELRGTPVLVGVLPDDENAVRLQVGSATFEDRSGTNVHVTLTGFSLSGSAAGNYTLQIPNNVTGRVYLSPQPVAINVSMTGYTYGDTPPVPTPTTESRGIVSYFYRAEDAAEDAWQTWDTKTPPQLNAGNYQMKAKVAPHGIYAEQESTPTSFRVAKAALTPPENGGGKATYNGQVQVSSLKSSDLYTVTQSETGRDCKKYDVVLTLTEDARKNYYWSGRSESEVSLTVQFEITQEQYWWTSSLSINGWEYGSFDAGKNTPSITTNRDSSLIRYLYRAQGASSFTETRPTRAGTHEVKAVLQDSANNYYRLETDTVSFTIKRRPLSVTGLEVKDKTYDGNASADFIGTPTLENTVGTDDVGLSHITPQFSDAGIGSKKTIRFSTVSLIGADAANYTLSPLPTIKASILPKVIMGNYTYDDTTIPKPQIERDGTGGSTTYYYGSSEDSCNTVWRDSIHGKTLNAGTYYIKVKRALPNETAMESVPVAFTVNKKEVALPDPGSAAYTGKTQTCVLIKSNDIYRVTENMGGIQIGSYDVMLTLVNPVNYRWPDTDSSSTIVKFEITKSLNDWQNLPTIRGWTYGEYPQTPTAVAKMDSEQVYFGYRYGDPGSEADAATYEVLTPSATMKAGIWYMRAYVPEGSAAALISAPVQFTILPKSVTISGITANDKPYNGETEASFSGTPVIVGLLGNDDVHVKADSGRAYFANANAGVDKRVIFSEFALEGKDVGNYTLLQPADTTATILPGSLATKPVLVMSDFLFGAKDAPMPAVKSDTVPKGADITYYYGTSATTTNVLWDSKTATSLQVGTYYMRAFIAAVGNYDAGESDAVEFHVTLGKRAKPSPDPSFDVETLTVSIPAAYRDKSLEYSLDNVSFTPVPKLTNGTFVLSGVQDNTDYTLYLRYAATTDGNYAASESAWVKFKSPNRYSVSFQANGGVGTVPETVVGVGGTGVTAPSGTGMSRNGYTFVGWNTKSEGGGNSYPAGATIKTGATLYAQWSPNKYSVKFNSNGGTGSMSNQHFVYDTAAALRANSFTREGYSFAGWSTSKDGGAQYADTQVVENLSTGSDVTLYAIWTEGNCSVNGMVTESGTGVSGVKVSLLRNGQAVSTAITGSDGRYGFSHVEAGSYTISATAPNGASISDTIAVSSSSVVPLALPTQASSRVILDDATAGTSVNHLSTEVAAWSDEDHEVSIVITVEKPQPMELPDNAPIAVQAVQNDIQVMLRTIPSKSLEYYDITVEKTIGEETQLLTSTKNVLEIVIPFQTAYREGLTVYRSHDGAITRFTELSARATENLRDGTYYIGDGYVAVYASKFSVYAIGYEDTDPTVANIGSADASNVTANISVDADNTKPSKISSAVWFGTGIVAVAGVSVLLVRRRKRNHA